MDLRNKSKTLKSKNPRKKQKKTSEFTQAASASWRDVKRLSVSLSFFVLYFCPLVFVLLIYCYSLSFLSIFIRFCLFPISFISFLFSFHFTFCFLFVLFVCLFVCFKFVPFLLFTISFFLCFLPSFLPSFLLMFFSLAFLPSFYSFVVPSSFFYLHLHSLPSVCLLYCTSNATTTTTTGAAAFTTTTTTTTLIMMSTMTRTTATTIIMITTTRGGGQAAYRQQMGPRQRRMS